MSKPQDRLYELLPVVYRQRDAEQGYPLRDLLRVITEQVDVVEADIFQLYENWFIETCQDWVVPYIGDLIGYRPVPEAGEPGDVRMLGGQQRNKILIPRREVANTIRYRQRKGTLALLELLANDVAGWSVRAVEFYKLLGWTQDVNHSRISQGRTVDLRQGDALDRLNGPFDEIAHTVDVRRIQSPYDRGHYNIPNVGVFIWRLKTYSVTKTPAYCLEEVSPNCYSFSVLGNDTQLYVSPQSEAEPTHIAEELNLPIPIRRRALEIDKRKFNESQVRDQTYTSLYYDKSKSLQIWLRTPVGTPFNFVAIPFEQIIPADLSDWQYRPPQDKVAVDPVLGRIVFPPRQVPKAGVWVTYQYAFSANIGGGEYDRMLLQPAQHKLYQVGRLGEFTSINAAIDQWWSEYQEHPNEEKYRHAVIEITDSGVYTERFDLHLEANQSLQIRAANHTRPVIRLLDYQAETTDSLRVTVQPGSRFTLDGLLIVGRGVQVQQDILDFPVSSEEKQKPAQEEIGENKYEDAKSFLSSKITIRHSTLVPGWALHCDCEPKRPAEPSLELLNLKGQVKIEHSIIGSIQINQDEVQADPIPIHIRNSILDATSMEREALDAPGCAFAHARLTIQCCTIFGKVLVHSIDLAENSIFDGIVTVARRQQGCMRFCYVTPSSRTPRRYNCQPDLVEAAIAQELKDTAVKANKPQPTEADLRTVQQVERDRIHPQFNSTRYGTPTYCQLANTCAGEIKQGADDESEMGVFHDLYQPQRDANLRARLNEYTPAEMEIGIIYAS
ncbi:hypothetical protein WA1_47490 [Scytonema hofmannii PCC 7110]|uniref:Uncharacterized protein n=1 Tax=Scytonema hofmannii PCC 7110 TaxID=128403 RepID=A0A139WXU8_9CYAN|nr:hypothetical protein [Scytonema hofmannii]KYC37267.1 hypothetical protein WA1_47490 [Scytonema hofmannii PCC 7110]